MNVFIFPGQGAQFPGMGLEAYKSSDKIKSLFNQADEILGFNVTINTDNRLMSDISMSEEVNNVIESFNLKEDDINSITKNTIEAGFVNYDLRKKLIG